MVILKSSRISKRSFPSSLAGKLSANHGFTLVEVMVAITILGIISAIALPSFSDYVLRSNRVEAKTMLINIAQKMEKYYATNFSYTNDLLALGLSASPFITENGNYSIRVIDNGGGGGACPIGNCYLLEASAIGNQAEDTDCELFTMNSSGDKAAYDSSNNENSNC